MPQESKEEKLNRELIELLNELRVALPGVQILFAFLLTVPFTPRFPVLSEFQRIEYFVTLLAAGVAAMLLIAPTSYHRILFRCGDKEYLVRVANRYTMAGLLFVAIAMVGVVLLVSDMMFSQPFAFAMAGAAGVGAAFAWYALPIRRRLRLMREC